MLAIGARRDLLHVDDLVAGNIGIGEEAAVEGSEIFEMQNLDLHASIGGLSCSNLDLMSLKQNAEVLMTKTT